MFIHEYGHYLQSQKYGPAYLPVFAIPSLIKTTFNLETMSFYTEADATTRGAAFFGFTYQSWYTTFYDADSEYYIYQKHLEYYLRLKYY